MNYKEKQIDKFGKTFMMVISYFVLLFIFFVAFMEYRINKNGYWNEVKNVWKDLILI